MKSLIPLTALFASLMLVGCSGDARTTTDSARSGDTVASASRAAVMSDSAAIAAGREAQAAKVRAAKTMDKSDPNVVAIGVTSMQCGMCVRTIRKALRELDGAQEVKVDLATKTAFVRVENNTPEMRNAIETKISKAGYSTETMKADPDAYEKLDSCCKVGGMKG